MGAPQAWYKRRQHGSMTRKRVDRDHQENPISGMARWPAGNSGKIDMQLSQHSTERGISDDQKMTAINQQLIGI